MIIKSYSQFINIYEWHESGADAPEVTLERAINNILERGLSKEILKSWIQKIIDLKDYYPMVRYAEKNAIPGLPPLRQPEDIQIIWRLYLGIDTVFDDGYLPEDLYKSLEKVYNEMK